MTFSVTGKIGKYTASVTYSKLPLLKHKLTGNPAAVELIENEARVLNGQLIGPIGTYFEKDYLEEPLAALFVMLEVFDEVLEISGDVPEADDVPDGAIC